MSLTTLLACAAVVSLIICLLIWRWERRHFLELAAKVPGPPTEFLLGNAREFGKSPREMYVNIVRIWGENGPLFRLWIGPFFYVVVSDPKDVEIIMGSTKYIDKAIIYNFLQPWLGTGLLTSTGQKWHKHRKIITPTFHFKILEQFMDVFNSSGEILIKSLRKVANGKAVDIYDFITLHALDVICETAMGVRVNAQKSSNSVYVNAIRREADLVIRRLVQPWLYPDFMFNLSSSGKVQKETLKVLHGMTNEVIQDRKQRLLNDKSNCSNGHVAHNEDDDIGRKKRLAFLDLLLQSIDDGAILSDENIREEVDTFMFEGHDTTTSAICFTLYLLSKNEDVQEKAVEELQSVFGMQDDIVPTCQNLTEMKYLECIIKEALRLYPSVPFIGRYLNEDTRIKTGNLVLPAGTSVLISPYLVHRHEDYFKDPERFDPDRFTQENSQGRHPYSYFPFSAGPRNCIGQKFAMMEMKTTIAKILWHYHLSEAPGFEPELTIELILKSLSGIKLQITPRAKPVTS